MIDGLHFGLKKVACRHGYSWGMCQWCSLNLLCPLPSARLSHEATVRLCKRLEKAHQCWYRVIMPAYGAAPYLPAIVLERPVYLREMSDGLYSPFAYLLYKVRCQAPGFAHCRSVPQRRVLPLLHAPLCGHGGCCAASRAWVQHKPSAGRTAKKLSRSALYAGHHTR